MVTARLASLNWRDFVQGVAPILVLVILVSGTIVRLYGESKAQQIKTLMYSELKRHSDVMESEIRRIEESHQERLGRMKLEMQLYTDKHRDGRFTSDMFDREMEQRERVTEAALDGFRDHLDAIDELMRSHTEKHAE